MCLAKRLKEKQNETVGEKRQMGARQIQEAHVRSI